MQFTAFYAALSASHSMTTEFYSEQTIILTVFHVLSQKEALFRTRKRILKYLILGFLKQEGYVNTAETFVEEAAVTSEFQLCDNIDLDIILQVSIIIWSILTLRSRTECLNTTFPLLALLNARYEGSFIRLGA